MNEKQLKETAFRAFELELKIRALEAEQKALKKALVIEALSRPTEHIHTGCDDGTKYIVQFAGGEAHIIFPADSIKSSLKSDSKDAEKLISLVPEDKWFQLFDSAKIIVPKPDFRNQANQILSPKIAEKVINLVTSSSAPKVNFKEEEAS